MNLDITKMEIKRLRKHLLIGIIAPAAYSLLIMVFYIAFAEVFKDMSSLFESASLKALLNAFSMDANTFSYILSYYVSYNGVYMLIMGIIFASTLAVKLFSKEIKDGTYEFIYANPVSRIKIFFSKSLVIVFYLVVLNVVVFIVGFTSIEVLKTKSPIVAWLDEVNVEMLREKIDEKPSLVEYFERDEGLFYEVMFSSFESQFTRPSGHGSMDIDMDLVSDLLLLFINDPDSIFDEMIDHPKKYMVLFDMDDEAAYINTIQKQKDAYFMTKTQFMDHASVAGAFFNSNPKPFMNQVDADEVDEFAKAFDLTDQEKDRLFVYYSFENFLKLSITTFLVMLSIALFVMMLVIIVPKGKMTSGLATGICMIIYFMNMMSNIAEPVRFLRYFTPLSYINMRVMDVNYQTDTWAIVVISGIILLSYLVSVVGIKKSDLIA